MTLSDTVQLTPLGRRRRARRWMARAAALLLLVGSLGVALAIDSFLGLALLGGPLLLSTYVLFSLAGGRKSVVLYLRRFGLTLSGNVVSRALESGLSGRYRIVTLDDSQFPALEVPPWERRLSRFGPPVLAAVLVGAFVFTVRSLRQQGNFLFLSLTAVTIPALAIGLWLLLTLFALLVIHRMRIRRQARIRIASDQDLEEGVRRVDRLGGWWRTPGIMAPQATVLGVDDGLWQKTVARLSQHASAVLLDVSEPTDNLVWELEAVSQSASARVVFVGERSLVTHWVATRENAAASTATNRVAALIGEGPVLLYDSADRRSRGGFRRHLMTAFDNLGIERIAGTLDGSTPSRGGWDRLWHGARVAATYLLAPIFATLVSYVALTIADPGRFLFDLFASEYHFLDALGSAERQLERRQVPATPEALAIAARAGDAGLVAPLLDVGIAATSRTASGWTPLLLASNTGDAATIGRLLDAGGNVEDRTRDGRSALMLAASRGHAAAVEVLLDRGASINETSTSGSALSLAVRAGHRETVDLLLARGADPTLRHSGLTPLMEAAALGRAEVMASLLAARGTDVNASGDTGRTALVLASIGGCAECVRAMLAKGAGADGVDAFGATALEYAVFNRHDSVVKLLESAGARDSGRVSAFRRSRSDETNRSGPHANLVVAGGLGEAAAVLVSALTKGVARWESNNRFWAAERLTDLPASADGRPRLQVVEFASSTRHYSLCLPADDREYRKALVSGGCPAEGVVLVAQVGSSDPPLDQHIRVARQSGVATIVAVLDVGSVEADDTSIAQAERTVRDALRRHAYSDAPIMKVSSSGVLRGQREAEQSLDLLIAAIDERVPSHPRDVDGSFLFTIEDASVSGGQPIAAGRIESGSVRLGDRVEIVGLEPTQTTVVAEIERFRRKLSQATSDDGLVNLTLEGIALGDLEQGRVIASPNTIAPYSSFEAIIYMLDADEGGRLTAAGASYRPQLYLRTTDVTGLVRASDSGSSIAPGDTVTALVELAVPVALGPGLTFVVREGGRSVGVGRVVRALN